MICNLSYLFYSYNELYMGIIILNGNQFTKVSL